MVGPHTHKSGVYDERRIRVVMKLNGAGATSTVSRIFDA
jgi:hypothetical protein